MKSKLDPELYVTRKEYDDVCEKRDMYCNLYSTEKVFRERYSERLSDAYAERDKLAKRVHKLRREKDELMTKLVNAYQTILLTKL